jgi:Nucleotidyl transferase AbiEii toxin, Type IV TA system
VAVDGRGLAALGPSGSGVRALAQPGSGPPRAILRVSDPVLHEDFRDLLVELQEAGVRFVIVGAHALAVHGLPRATGDLDLFVARDAVNAERLMTALARYGAPVESHEITSEDFQRPDTVYQLGLVPRRIDLMTSIDGVEFDDAERSAVIAELDGLRLPVLGRRELLANKIASGRPKDLADLEWLRGSAPQGDV